MIIGVTGTNGSGKGTVVDYLIQKGFVHYSAREFLTDEIKRRGMPVDRSSMREVANGMRLQHGAAYVIESLFTQAKEAGSDAVIESVRALGEADFLKEHGAVLLAVDADRALRYERIVQRGSATDKVDFDTWVMQEEREWHNSATHDMNVPAVMERADFTISNNDSLAELYGQIDEVLARITK